MEVVLSCDIAIVLERFGWMAVPLVGKPLTMTGDVVQRGRRW